MDILLRESQPSDFPFLREMLYEAIFWRAGGKKPSFEEGLAFPDSVREIAEWGERDGDTAVIAVHNAIPIGAAWYRFWTGSNFTNGYVDEETPVLGVAVHNAYRHQGIGKKLVEWLIDHASKYAVQKISLNVAKDNYAINLYIQLGFQEYADKGDAVTMVRKIRNITN